MNKLSIALVIAGLFTIAGAAEAKKPVVCENWLPYSTTRADVKDAPKVWLCLDKEDKPFAMFDVRIVPSKDKEGNTVNWAIGYR